MHENWNELTEPSLQPEENLQPETTLPRVEGAIPTEGVTAPNSTIQPGANIQKETPSQSKTNPRANQIFPHKKSVHSEVASPTEKDLWFEPDPDLKGAQTVLRKYCGIESEIKEGEYDKNEGSGEESLVLTGRVEGQDSPVEIKISRGGGYVSLFIDKIEESSFQKICTALGGRIDRDRFDMYPLAPGEEDKNNSKVQGRGLIAIKNADYKALAYAEN